MSDLREALEVLMDGDDVRELSRHTVTDFPAAVATLAEAARRTLDPVTTEEVEEAWQSFNAGYVLRSDVRAVLEAFLETRWLDRG